MFNIGKFLQILLAVLCIGVWVALLGPWSSQGPIGHLDRWTGPPLLQRPLLGQSASFARVVAVLSLFALAALFSLGKVRREPISLFVWMGASVSATIGLSSSLKELTVALGLFLPYFFILKGREGLVRRMRLVLRGLLLLQVFVGLVAYFGRVDQFVTPGFGARASGLLHTPNAIYIVALISFWEFLLTAEESEDDLVRWLWRYAALLSFALVYLTFSRVALLGLLVGTVAWSLGRGKRFLTVPGVVFLAAVAGTLLRSPEQTDVLSGDRSTIGHALTIRMGLQVLEREPIFGGGVHSFIKSPEYRELRIRSFNAPWEPKSLVLNYAIDYGLPCAGIFVLWLALPVCVRQCSDSNLRGSVASILLVAFLGSEVFTNSNSLPSTGALLAFYAIRVRYSFEGRRDGGTEAPCSELSLHRW